jgi:hypothetical protein
MGSAGQSPRPAPTAVVSRHRIGGLVAISKPTRPRADDAERASPVAAGRAPQSPVERLDGYAWRNPGPIQWGLVVADVTEGQDGERFRGEVGR